MNGTDFRRGLLLAGIRNGLDLGEALATAKEADAWCCEAGAGEILGQGGAMPEIRLALPSPGRGTSPVADAVRSPRAPREETPARKGPRKARGTRRTRNGDAPPKPRSAASAAQAKRHVTATGKRWKKIDKALAAAGPAGLSGVALRTAVGCSGPTLVLDLRAMDDVVRVGPKVGKNVRWVLARFAGVAQANSKSKPARQGAPIPDRAAPPAAGAAAAEREAVAVKAAAPAGGASALPLHGNRPAPVARQSALVRNEKVEREVLAAVERGAADLATLCQRTSWPDNAVRNALAALAHEKAIVAQGGVWRLAGVEA